jgi:hypothetical protein
MEVSGSVSRSASESVWLLRNKMPPPDIVLRFLGLLSTSLFDVFPCDCVTPRSESQFSAEKDNIVRNHVCSHAKEVPVWLGVAQAASCGKLER